MTTLSQIRQRLRHTTKWVTSTVTDIFDSNVPENKIRYIVKIIVTGDQTATRVLNLYKKSEAGTYSPILPNINVAAPEYKEIPQGSYDPEKPFLTLEGGTNLAGMVDGNSLAVMVVYWDSEV